MSEPGPETMKSPPETEGSRPADAPEAGTDAGAGDQTPPEPRVPAARIRVTDAALEALQEMTAEAELPAEAGIRLSAKTGAGCSVPLQYDMVFEAAPEDDDRIFELDGVRVFMDPESAWVLDGLLVDYVTDSPMGEGFAFRHPRSSGGRSC